MFICTDATPNSLVTLRQYGGEFSNFHQLIDKTASRTILPG